MVQSEQHVIYRLMAGGGQGGYIVGKHMSRLICFHISGKYSGYLNCLS